MLTDSIDSEAVGLYNPFMLQAFLIIIILLVIFAGMNRQICVDACGKIKPWIQGCIEFCAKTKTGGDPNATPK